MPIFTELSCHQKPTAKSKGSSKIFYLSFIPQTILTIYCAPHPGDTNMTQTPPSMNKIAVDL